MFVDKYSPDIDIPLLFLFGEIYIKNKCGHLNSQASSDVLFQPSNMQTGETN